MKTVASWLDSESLAELGLLAERKGVVVNGCATKHAVIQALLSSGKALQPVADAPPAALHAGAECGAQGPTSMSGTVVGQAAAPSSAAARDASADNGVQETPPVSQLAAVRAIEAEGGGDRPASRRSPDLATATTSSEGIRTKKWQGVSGVERQSTPRPGHGSSRVAGKWKGTPAWRTSPELGKSATTPRNTAVRSGTGGFLVNPEQTSPCELRCKCSRVHSNGRSSPPSATSPELAETATTPAGTAASTAARAPASAGPPTTSTGLRDSSSARAATNGVDNPASRMPPEPTKAATTRRGTAASTGTRFASTAERHSKTNGHHSSNDDGMAAIGRSNPSPTLSPHPAKNAVTTPPGTAASTATRVPSSVRQPPTPTPTNHRKTDGAVTTGRGNPASTPSPHPAKTVTTPRNTAVSTGNRVFFGSRQPTTPTSLRAARAANSAKISPASTPSPHPAKTAVTTPRGTAAWTSTRVPSSGRQPTTPTGRRGNSNGRAVTTGRGNPASTPSPHPAKTVTTPRNTAVSTGNRVFFGSRQPTTPTSLRAARAAKNAKISPASTPSPHPAKTAVTTPRGTAASTSTRVPSSTRQPTTPTGRRGNNNGRAVTTGRGNPASTPSPHPAKTVTTPRNTVVSTGNRVFFGSRQPTTPTSLRAARAAKNAKISPASTPSPHPAKTAVTTPRGTAAWTSTRVPSSGRQPTTPTGRRGNSNDRAATDTQTSRSSSEPTGAAKTPRSMPGATRDRISLVARQAAEGIRRRSTSARASANGGGNLASGRSPDQADATTSSGISSLLADSSSSMVASHSAKGLGSTSSGGTIEGRHLTAHLSPGPPEDSGSGVEPSPIVPATGEDSPFASEPSEMEPAEAAEAAETAPTGGETRDRPVQQARPEVTPVPTCSMAEYMLPQIHLLNALQRAVLLNPF